jgi:hypothetical protein
MQENRRVVTRRKQRSPSRLPEWATQGAVLVQGLIESGTWARLAEELRVARAGGYVGIDVALFFVMFFAAQMRDSLKKFGQASALYRHQLAALGTRVDFPTPSSVSRFLAVVEHSHVRALMPWLLLDGCHARDALGHPAAASYDTQEQAWQVFDWDSTNTVLRQRALPVGPELPAAKRLSDEVAKPGYTGRKRGEVKFSRATLQHAGTGLWLDIAATEGRADTAVFLRSALDAITETCRYAELPLERALIRADGAGGNVPWISECQKKGIRYVARSAHYGLLGQGQQDIQRVLATAAWRGVPSSGSGPQRFAAELGIVELLPSRHALAAEGGEDLEPVHTRMVVSRFRSDEKKGAGEVIDGWQYELYANDLPADAWPCEEVVALYYGRCGQENRFCQEDRELGLDRIFSYNLPGQELATLLGLFVWNLRITEGFKLERPPLEKPAQCLRTEFAEPEPPTVTETTAATETTTATETTAATETTSDESNSPRNAPSPELVAALDKHIDWPRLLLTLPGFERSADHVALVCPERKHLPISLTSPSGRQPRLRFLAAESACRACPQRVSCGSGATPINTSKNVTLRLDPAIADELSEHIAKEQQRRRELRHLARPGSTPAPRTLAHPSPRVGGAIYKVVLAAPIAAGHYAAMSPRLLVAKLRESFGRACMHAEVRVDIQMPAPRAPHSPVIASSSQQRQRCRQTWGERLLRNSLPPDASAMITFDDHAGLLRFATRPASSAA